MVDFVAGRPHVTMRTSWRSGDRVNSAPGTWRDDALASSDRSLREGDVLSALCATTEEAAANVRFSYVTLRLLSDELSGRGVPK